MENREAIREKLAAKMAECHAQMDLLKAKMEGATADAKLDYGRQLEGLEAKYQATLASLKKLTESADSAWQDLKVGAELAVEDLRETVRSATERFR